MFKLTAKLSFYLKPFIPPVVVSIYRFFRDLFLYLKSNPLESWGLYTTQKQCLVLGNGLSLSNSYLQNSTFFKKNDVFCVNFFPLTNFFFEIKPKYWVLCDPILWKDKVINSNHERTIELIKTRLKKIIFDIDWQIKIIIPKQARNSYLYNLLNKNKNLQLCLVNLASNVYMSEKKLFKFYKANVYAPPTYNVINLAIYSALNIGFKEICVFGLDMNQIQHIRVDKNNIINRSHINIGDHGKVTLRPDMNMTDFYEQHFKVYETFKLLDSYSKFLNSKIINYTQDSMIDIFEKKNI